MTGYLLLADGERLEGTLHGAAVPAAPAMGWLAANTAVVGFQEMATDPAYKHQVLAFTYPEVGNVGVAERFSESTAPQVAGLVVKVLNDHPSHYLSEASFESMLARGGVPCLSDVDTRALAVHIRRHGQMPAAIVPEGADRDEVQARLGALDRPEFEASEAPTRAGSAANSDGAVRGVPTVCVLDLGIRRSQLAQLGRCGRPVVLRYDAGARDILAGEPAWVFVSDGPGAGLPPAAAVETLRALLGKVPILGCGLGHVALGLALGCEAEFLRNGHHGANYPVRNLLDGKAEVTHQRHTVALKRQSVLDNPEVELLWENMTDQTVEGIRARDGSAVGLQAVLAEPTVGAVNGHILEFARAAQAGRKDK